MNDLRRILSVCALASLLALPAHALAGTAVLLRDIADDPLSTDDSDLRQLTAFKDQVAFTTPVANGPYSLWMSDGTGPGTRAVFLQSCEVSGCEIPEILGTVNGFLLFSAQSEELFTPRRLWRSDGTRAGTIQLTSGDVALPNTRLGEGGAIVVTDRFLYFLGCGDTQCGVWRSDGTPAGTVLWKPYDGPGRLSGLTLSGDRLYAVAFESGSIPELWTVETKTGSEAFVGNWSASPTFLTAAGGGKLFFLAPSEDNSLELWVSNGTAGGTRPLTQLAAHNPFEETEWMQAIGGRVYFVANDVVHGFELWRSDGTPQGTGRVSDFGFFNALQGLQRSDVAEVGGKVLFTANDGLTTTKLWMSDGRPESTAPFRGLCPAGACELPQSGSRLLRIGGKVFFPGENGLWSTDGTFAGTHRFAGPLCTWECNYQPVFQALRNRIVFTVRDAQGLELWTSDGTSAGTRRLTNMPEAGSFPIPIQGPVVAAGRWTYFAARDRHGLEPWVTDGRETRLLADLGRSAFGSGVGAPASVGSRVFFSACDGRDLAVWTSGGTPESTALVPGTSQHCSPGSSSPIPLTAVSGRVFFRQDRQLWSTDGGVPVQVSQVDPANDAISEPLEFQGRLLVPIRTGEQLALWQSNAAGDGLVKLIDLPGLSGVEHLRAAGGEVYFRGSGQQSDGLWRTDGTQAGTRKLGEEVYPASDVVRLGSSALFMAWSRDESGFPVTGLWKSDGTPAGTVPVKVPLEGFHHPPQELTLFQGALYFFAPDGSWALWRSDGTEAGTVPVRQFADEEDLSGTWFGLTVLAGKLFFTAEDGIHGRELWTSDGTAGGTRMVIDLNPGRASGAPGPSTLTAAGGRLYFAGNDGLHGTELWESDGTAAGTLLVHDIAPEAASSLPGLLTPAAGHLFFVADDALTGREPWALPLAGPAGCQPSSTRLCLNGGRYRVEASWLTVQGESGTGRPVPLSGDTGAFWFFDPDNVELVVKVLDGQGVNGHVWVFYGALSDVEYTITVTDTQTGLTRRYFNPQGTLASVGDTHGFGPLGASSAKPVPPGARAAASPLPLVSERTDKAAAAPCQPGALRLCLNENRFAVEVSWKDPQNRTGRGTAVPLTGDTGTFWFFDAANVELVVKVLDGRPVNGKHWVFYGALSNVEYTLTVTDTQTGTVRTYKNPSGRFASAADTGAF